MRKVALVPSCSVRPHDTTRTPVIRRSSAPVLRPLRPPPPIPRPPPSSCPPPPSFRPPLLPPPSVSCYPTDVYQSEALYTEIDDGYLEVLEALYDEADDSVFDPPDSSEDQWYQHYQPPGRLTGGPQYQNRAVPPQEPEKEAEDIDLQLRWLNAMASSRCLTPSLYGLSLPEETRAFTRRAACVRRALRLFRRLLAQRGPSLRAHVSELLGAPAHLATVQKKTKKMVIAGATTGAVGGTAVVVGIALAPLTMGVSLISSAVGAGILASAGGLGAHAAKLKKKKVDKEQVEETLRRYKAEVGDVERCLALVLSGMDELRRHDLARLRGAGAQPEVLRVAELAQAVFGFGGGARGAVGMYAADGRGTFSERLLDAFAKETDLHFTHGDGQKLKKGAQEKFSQRVCLLAEGLQESLDEMHHMQDTFSPY